MKFVNNLGRAESDFVLSRLINETNSAEGPILPPQQRGEFRVPFVKNLRILKTISYFGSTQFTLGWDEPEDTGQQVSHFNIYVFGLLTNNRQPIGPQGVQGSPAEVRLQSQSATTVTFVVQTVLKNGQVSDLSRSPSASGVTVAGAFTAADFPDGTVPLAALADGTAGQLITWDAAGVITTIGPGTADNILVGSGAGAVPQFKSRTTLDLVEGRSLLTTAARSVRVSAAGKVTEFSYESAFEATVNTTDATPTTIYTLAIPTTTTLGIRGQVFARRTGGSSGTDEDGALFTFDSVWKNVAGTATQIGSGVPAVVGADQDWNVTYSPSSANVLIQVTGAANNNITWRIVFRTYPVS